MKKPHRVNCKKCPVSSMAISTAFFSPSMALSLPLYHKRLTSMVSKIKTCSIAVPIVVSQNGPCFFFPIPRTRRRHEKARALLSACRFKRVKESCGVQFATKLAHLAMPILNPGSASRFFIGVGTISPDVLARWPPWLSISSPWLSSQIIGQLVEKEDSKIIRKRSRMTRM